MTTHGDQRDPREIEHEIERTRAEMDGTLTALEQKLSPGQLLDEAIVTLRESAGRTAVSLAETVRRHPLPVALGTALVATMLARRGADGERRAGDADTTRRWMTLLSAALAQARMASESGGDRAAELASEARRFTGGV